MLRHYCRIRTWKCPTHQGKGHGLVSIQTHPHKSVGTRNNHTNILIFFTTFTFWMLLGATNMIGSYCGPIDLRWFAPITQFGFGPLLQVEGCMPIWWPTNSNSMLWLDHDTLDIKHKLVLNSNHSYRKFLQPGLLKDPYCKFNRCRRDQTSRHHHQLGTISPSMVPKGKGHPLNGLRKEHKIDFIC